MKELRLTLKSTWFRLVRDGKRRNEYREISPFYCARLCANYDPKKYDCQHCRTSFCRPVAKMDRVHFTWGYPAKDDARKHVTVKVKQLRKGYGNILYGACNRKVFIIDFE